ncbi:MAG: hypothetical protein KC800_00540 [Candidatus Eremiobacteraeota bacterium]|nr:hypothetical protein [Candidatus Eremiobacteraeota bacterium]
MGFIQDFGPKRPPTANPPQAPPSAPASVPTPSDRPRPKQRGFFADFNPEAALAQEQRDSFVPRHAPVERSEETVESQPVRRSWSSPVEEETEEVSVTSNYTGSTLTTLWEPPSQRTSTSSTPAVSSLEVSSLAGEIRSISEKLQSISPYGGGSDNKVSEIEQEISRTKYALSQAKESVQYKRKKQERVEKMLERTKRMVSHMEMRMSGYDSGGWGRGGGGGGRWRHRHNDEFLYSREELRGPENKEERQAQMGLVLDSRRDRIWKLQDELSNSRSAYLQAESRVKELETKVDRLQDQLYQARHSKQNKQEQKSKLESKLSDLKARYRMLTGKSYGQLF